MQTIAIQNAGPNQSIQHWCALCQKPFTYRFDEFYNSDQLRQVDRICRECFPKWVTTQEARYQSLKIQVDHRAAIKQYGTDETHSQGYNSLENPISTRS